MYQDRQLDMMLHLAAIFNHTEIAMILLEFGAVADVVNQTGETALDCAQPTLRTRMETRMDEIAQAQSQSQS